MQRYAKTIVVSLLALGVSAGGASPAQTQETDMPGEPVRRFYERSAEGWFWYKKEPEHRKREKQKEALPPPSMPSTPTAESPPSNTGPAPFSAAWLREELPKAKDRAIDTPTPENIRAYYYLQRVAMDKAEKFANVAERVVVGDPVLDEVSRRSLATFAANKQNELAGNERDRQLEGIAKRAGLFFFYKSDCPYCEMQAPVLEALATAFGFTVRAISLDGEPLPNGLFPDFIRDNGQAAQLGVTVTPTIFLANPPNGLAPIAAGVLSLEELKRRIMVVAVQQGWITEEKFNQSRPVNPAPSLANPMEGQGTPIDIDNATSLVNYLRSRIKE